MALNKKGEYEKALVEFETAKKQYPDYRIQQGIGAAAGEIKEWDKAIKAYKAYIKDGADQITPEMRASAEQEIDWLKTAKEAYQLFKKKKLEAALASFERAYGMHQHFEFLFYIGKIEAVLGNNVKALEAYKNFMSKGGNKITPVLRSEAELEIERLTALVKEEERKEEARVKFDQGLSMFDQGENEKTVELLEQSYKLDAQYEIQYYLGGALEKLEQYAKARESYERYLNEGKGDINNARRKEVLAKIEHIKEIETDLENKDRAETLYQKGMSLADRQLYEDALHVFEESYKVFPNYKALRGIGRSAIGLKRYNLAYGAYERYLREGEGEISSKTAVRIEKLIDKLKRKEELSLKREESLGHFETGMNLRTQGAYKQAVDEYEKAYDILPSYKIHYSIGKTYGLLKSYDEAAEAYNRFLDQGGDKVKPSIRKRVKDEIEMLNGLKKVMEEKGVETKTEEESVDKAGEDQGKKSGKKAKKTTKKKKTAKKKKATEEDLSLIP
jgi:tetratricopeptide (TPR) repeat protein